ncbi:mechanosensitive ion channel family protein [Kitasatospora viridis]|uniref:Small-conductance mechanosensitive channel n=1 Tax=Kitasatospora viridis TaxID=281105 RepID=A0A561SDV5_9ACTN|nr:mechanosensitive ion channel domain-containing protein [Kitasatospora viridis]TWF73030.1 small-conductance mechanosensitive channel [Kitasatospora viridis]
MWWNLARLAAAGAVIALGTYALNRTAEWAARGLADRGLTRGLPRILRSSRHPMAALLASLLALSVQPWIGAPPSAGSAVRHLLVLLAIAAGGWLGVRVVGLLVDGAVRLAVLRRDAAWAGRARTQASLVGRLCQAIVGLAALGAALMTFPAVRGVGTSLLASAGLVGLVAGVAAQSTLANLVAGIQMAFGDLARIGDVVVVAGEWGTVEEITLTCVVIATWDQRRLVMPMSYFVSRPFENWSRRSSRITGTALLHLDHRTPVAPLRAEFDAFLAGHPLWDGEGSALQVVDTTPTSIVVRVLATAANGADAFELRCQLREHLLAFLCEKHPQALPRVAVMDVSGPRPEPADAPFGHNPPPNLHGHRPHRIPDRG